MDNSIKSWLYDIQVAINEIDNFFENENRVFENYINDIKTKRAVERNLEIIGEAVNRIIKKDENMYLTNVRKIIDTRNRIIHGYDSVSDDVIWSIIINHLPLLKKEVTYLLNN